MDHRLSVLVQIDLDGRHVRLIVTGRLTETNQRALYPVIHRARTLTSTTEVLVDLTCAEHLEATAVDLLSWEIDHGDLSTSGGPVDLALPAPAVAPLIASSAGVATLIRSAPAHGRVQRTAA